MMRTTQLIAAICTTFMLVPGTAGTAGAAPQPAAAKKTRAAVEVASRDGQSVRRLSVPARLGGREMLSLRDKLRTVLEFYRGRLLNTRDHNPWEVMHTIVAYGVESQVRIGGPRGEPLTAVGTLCFNRPCHDQRLFQLTRDGFYLKKGPGVQGHFGQLLAMLALARVRRDYPINVGGKTFRVEDLIKHEKATCVAGTELTFKLIGLAHYLDSNVTWRSETGETWNVHRLVREELAQPIRGVACGGTHRLAGLSLAVRKRSKRGRPLNGAYGRARQFIRQYHNYAFALQNSDGSFSTEWFRGPGAKQDPDRRLQTTGHILEWLLMSLPAESLTRPQTVKAVKYLTRHMLRGRRRDWEIGPLGHAIHALAIYDERVFQKMEFGGETPIARKAPPERK